MEWRGGVRTAEKQWFRHIAGSAKISGTVLGMLSASEAHHPRHSLPNRQTSLTYEISILNIIEISAAA